MKRVALVLVPLFGLTGCLTSVKTSGVEVKTDSVEVEVGESGKAQRNGTFCPPGQAKKGRC